MVGVSLPVASAGVGLVGLMPFGVALGSPAGCEESSRLVVGRTTSGLEAISLPSSVQSDVALSSCTTVSGVSAGLLSPGGGRRA